MVSSKGESADQQGTGRGEWCGVGLAAILEGLNQQD